MFIKALTMNTMSAFHKAYGLGRSEHIVAANRTIAVGRPLDALVVLLLAYGDASAASLV